MEEDIQIIESLDITPNKELLDELLEDCGQYYYHNPYCIEFFFDNKDIQSISILKIESILFLFGWDFYSSRKINENGTLKYIIQYVKHETINVTNILRKRFPCLYILDEIGDKKELDIENKAQTNLESINLLFNAYNVSDIEYDLGIERLSAFIKK